MQETESVVTGSKDRTCRFWYGSQLWHALALPHESNSILSIAVAGGTPGHDSASEHVLCIGSGDRRARLYEFSQSSA